MPPGSVVVGGAVVGGSVVGGAVVGGAVVGGAVVGGAVVAGAVVAGGVVVGAGVAGGAGVGAVVGGKGKNGNRRVVEVPRWRLARSVVVVASAVLEAESSGAAATGTEVSGAATVVSASTEVESNVLVEVVGRRVVVVGLGSEADRTTGSFEPRETAHAPTMTAIRAAPAATVIRGEGRRRST